MKYITSISLICLALPILFLIIFTPKPCEHNDTVTRYVFSSEDCVAKSSAAEFCRDCDSRITGYSLFEGTLVDQSYLEAIKEHSDGSEIVPGEYYTVNATVPLGYYGYGSNSLWLTCEVENADYIIRFNVEFKEEYRELVESVEEGEEITFRGRFYDKGCEFTDCELIK